MAAPAVASPGHGYPYAEDIAQIQAPGPSHSPGLTLITAQVAGG